MTTTTTGQPAKHQRHWRRRCNNMRTANAILNVNACECLRMANDRNIFAPAVIFHKNRLEPVRISHNKSFLLRFITNVLQSYIVSKRTAFDRTTKIGVSSVCITAIYNWKATHKPITSQSASFYPYSTASNRIQQQQEPSTHQIQLPGHQTEPNKKPTHKTAQSQVKVIIFYYCYYCKMTLPRTVERWTITR